MRGCIAIQDIIDGYRLMGIDARSSTMEIGLLLADGLLKPVEPHGRLNSWTVVELAMANGDGLNEPA